MKIFIQFFFILFVAYATSVGQGLDDNNDAKKLYNDGISMMKSGNFSGAYKKFDEASKIVDDYRLVFRKGETLRKQKKFEEAIAQYAIAIEMNKDYYPSYFYTAGSYYALNQFEKSLEFYQKTLQVTQNKKVIKATKKNIAKLNVKFAQPYLEKGNSLLQNNEYENAVANFLKVIEYYPSDAAFIGLADAYIKLGKYDEAIQAADNANNNRKSISKGAPFYYKGLAFKAKGDIQKAKENFNLGKKYSDYRQNCEFELKMLKS